MPTSLLLDRRVVLKGLAGVTLALPLLEAMGKEVAAKTPNRFIPTTESFQRSSGHDALRIRVATVTRISQ